MWDAFMYSPATEAATGGGQGGQAQTLRVAHSVFLDALLQATSSDEAARLLNLIGECARGHPEPLATMLLRYNDCTDQCARGHARHRDLLRALGTLPIHRGEWARAPLIVAAGHTNPLVATEAVVGLYRRLVEDQAFARSPAAGETMFARGVGPLLAEFSPARRLLALVAVASLFSARQPMVLGDAREVEFKAVVAALDAAALDALGAQYASTAAWRTLMSAHDFVGLALYSSEALAPRWDDADVTARAFTTAAIEGLVMVSLVSPTPSKCNLALAFLRAGDHQQAIRVAAGVMESDPACVEAHLVMLPLLVRAGVPRAKVSRLLNDIVATYEIDPRLQASLDAARSSCAETGD